MGLQEWANVATIVGTIGVITAVGALWFTWKQLKLSADNSRAQLWLDLRKMFHEHLEVHTKLRRGGEYAKRQPRPECCKEIRSWPCCDDEWVKVEAYMGLFEHCEGLLEGKLIDESTFRDIYSYRVKNIIGNEKIKATKLVELGKYWKRFRALANRFNQPLPLAKEID